MHLIQNRWCSELFTYVYVYWIRNSGSKTKTAHVSFPVGMVILILINAKTLEYGCNIWKENSGYWSFGVTHHWCVTLGVALISGALVVGGVGALTLASIWWTFGWKQLQKHPDLSSTTNYHSWFLTPKSELQKNGVFLQKNGFSCRKMHFPAEKYTFLQKNAVFWGAHGRKPQESARGFQGSRIKNASQLSQEI